MRRVFKVYEINRYIKSILEENIILSGLFIEGEISNYKNHLSGHSYFTLKDDKSSINCVMFKGSKENLIFEPENGMKVIVFGNISLYEKTGNYQLYAEMMEPSGKGALFLSFLQLKEKLENEGLFDEAFKKEIPQNPRCIAVITSKTGAAVRDIIDVCRRRDRTIKLVVVNTLVQGEKAPENIRDAIKLVNDWGKADVIILGRGGGSMEDLWAFNNEFVAREIFNSDIPIISAVGHETDFTIADFVSDLRAPTPSAAAELATMSLTEKYRRIKELNIILNKTVNNKLNDYKQRLNRAVIKSPMENIADRQKYIIMLYQRLTKATDQIIYNNKAVLSNKIHILESISPLKLLDRGFSVVSKKEKIVTSISEIKKSDNIQIRLKDGTVDAKVTNIEGDTNG